MGRFIKDEMENLDTLNKYCFFQVMPHKYIAAILNELQTKDIIIKIFASSYWLVIVYI